MKTQQNIMRVCIVLVVLIISLIYTLPSTNLWVSAFGVLSPHQQRVMPRRLIEFSDYKDAAVITLNANTAATEYLEADPETIVNEITDTVRKTIADAGYDVRVENIRYGDGAASLRIANIDSAKAEQLLETLSIYANLPIGIATIFPERRITHGLDLSGGIDLVYQVDRSSIQEGDSIADAVQRSIGILRNRIDMFGIAEPNIQSQDGYRIRIQIPGTGDLERVRDLIQSTAMLQFHIVKDQAMSAAQLEPVGEDELVLMQRGGPGQPAMWFKLERHAHVTGGHLRYARVTRDDFGAPVVGLEFNAEGAARFARLTGAHQGEQLAIVLDNNVHSAPVIQQRITGGQAQITGGFDMEEAQNLAITLRAGALPASLIALESRVVGPTLGRESIEAGWAAGIAGAVFILVYMLMFYRLCGLLADLAVLFNTLIIFAALVFFGGTLTLPGIAGLILTIGMAVDANVIIFERIKEEFRSGKTVKASINSGFDRATSCIIDSNVTTLLTVTILYIFGSGPIRGFATTLGIGLLANVFTAIFCVKFALDMIYSGRNARTISI